MKTSEKYYSALVDLHKELTFKHQPFNMSAFCRSKNLSNSFGAACVEAGIINRKKDPRGRFYYEWAVAGPYTKILGDVVREVISLRTNGNRPKIDREAVMSKSPENGRKRRESNGTPSGDGISGIIDRTRPVPKPGTTGGESGTIDEKSLAGDTNGFDEVAKQVSGLTEAITRHPGHIDGEKIIKRVQSSIFNRLCPTCAETLHQIIDLLKA